MHSKHFSPLMGPTDLRGRTENSQGEDDIISDGAEGQSHSLGLRLYPRGPCDQAGRSLGRQYLSQDLIGEKEPPWGKPRVSQEAGTATAKVLGWEEFGVFGK